MRKIWVKVDPWDKNIVTTALEGGADAIMVPKGFSEKVKQLGKIKTIAEDGDLVIGKDVVIHSITCGEDEEEIVKISRSKKVILQTTDWTIIPLENLIARGADVIAQVSGLVEAQTAFGILEANIALSCSSPPKGRSWWSLRLLADKSVELSIIDSISHEAVGRRLKK